MACEKQDATEGDTEGKNRLASEASKELFLPRDPKVPDEIHQVQKEGGRLKTAAIVPAI